MVKLSGKIATKFGDNVPPDLLLTAENSEFIVAGQNCGSLDKIVGILMRTGIKVILAKSFTTTLHNTLINFGILPLIVDDEIYEELATGDQASFPFIEQELASALNNKITLEVNGKTHALFHYLQPTERATLCAGGLDRYLKK